MGDNEVKKEEEEVEVNLLKMLDAGAREETKRLARLLEDEAKMGTREFLVHKHPDGTETVIGMADLSTHTSQSPDSVTVASGSGHMSPTSMWPIDKAHATFIDATHPRILGSREIDMSIAADTPKPTTFIAHHNMRRHLAVSVRTEDTVSVQRIPTSARGVSWDLFADARRCHYLHSGCSPEFCEGSGRIMRPALSDGRAVFGPCWSSTWTPPPASAFTEHLFTFTGITNMWVCNADAVPIDMPDAARASMDGHTIVVQGTVPDKLRKVDPKVGPLERGLFVIGEKVELFLLHPDEEVTCVWGGNTCTADVFEPCIFTTRRLIAIAPQNVISPLMQWEGFFNKTRTAAEAEGHTTQDEARLYTICP